MIHYLMLFLGFIWIEKNVASPLLPLSLFKTSSVLSGNLAMLFIGGATTGLFFALSVFMQQVLHYDALRAGLTQLPLAGALVVIAEIVPGIVEKYGLRTTLITSLIVLMTGLIWLAFAPSNASFAAHLLAPSLLIGIGLGGAFVTGTQLAVQGIDGQDAGIASGLVNTSQQIGGAVGLALLATLATSHTQTLLEHHVLLPQALTAGFSWAFLGAAVFVLIGVLSLLRSQKTMPSE